MNFKSVISKIVIFFFLVSNVGFSQDNNPWIQKSIPSNIKTNDDFVLGYYTLDLNKLKTILATSSEVKFPFADGNLALFKVTKKGVLSPDLQAKYPGIGTYSGAIGGIQKIDFTINSFGILGKVKIEEKVYTLKPVGNSNYILTFIPSETPPIDDDYHINQSTTSTTTSKLSTSSKIANLGPPSAVTSLKVYRIAIAPTAEYSNHFIDLNIAQNATIAEKKEIVITAIAETIDKVNSITIRDLGIKFELVLSNDKLIEFDTEIDKFTHGDKYALLDEVNSVINSKIGVNSYDLGHVFDYSYFGGVAYLRVLCTSSDTQPSKAQGVSGSGDPEIGDYFPGVVAHEIGHQLGALHTFNSNVGTGTNRVETGAGITIMGYGNMELFYHAKSIKEMNDYISNTTCAVLKSNSNTAPTYLTSPLPLTPYTIPAGTPFVLGDKFKFVDAQNDILSYNWDQMDAEATSNPPLPTSNVGPAFATYYPKDILVRYFPRLETVLKGATANESEVIPQVSREMNFTLNVREDNQIAPILVQEDFKVITINDGSGPFVVTSQGVIGTKYKQGDKVKVNWNKSSSTSTEVKISLSFDGGLTFTHDLKATTENDGSEVVILPILANTTSARIKVEPIDNIYYAINKVNFEITNPPFVFNIVKPSPVRCYGEQISKITIDPSGGSGAPYTISWFKKNTTSFQEVVDSDSDPKTLNELGVGLYKVRVTDKDGIVYEEEVTIEGPTNPLLVANVVNNNKPVLCFGDRSGQIALQASGGSAPYRYILNGTEVASNRGDSTLDTDNYLISNLTVASYTIKIVDANNCEAKPIIVQISGPSSALTLSNSVITNTTSSSNNGAVSITITGGTAPYNYSWTGPNSYTNSNQNISTLINGLYKLRVTDANGCSLESNFTIESQTTFNYNITQSNVSCKGGSNGSLSTFPSGGNGGPYQVVWTFPNGFTSTNFSINNLVAGVYELRIKDKLGEPFESKIITISEPQNALVISPSNINNIICYGDSTGSYGLNISGGTSPYTYSVNGIYRKTSGDSVTNSDVFTQENLSAGTYVVKVTDNSGCTANYQSVLTQPLNQVDISSFTITPITVKDALDGAIAIEVAGGTSPYTYSWTGPNLFTNNSNIISGLQSGTYTIVVKDYNNCLSVPRDFEIENPTPFEFNISPINPLCFGSLSGSITTNPRGGYGGPYSINWFKYNGTTYDPTNDGILDGNDLVLSKIGAGIYKIVVTDSRGISYTQENIQVEEPSNLQLVAGLIQSQSHFDINDGSFSVSISGGIGGTPPFTYILNDVIKFTNSNTSQAITGLASGDYVLTLKDKNGCYSNNSLAIYVPGPQEIIITNMADAVTPIKCFNSNDGKININVKGGGIDKYNFEWVGPSGFTSNDKNLSGLSKGIYRVKITDKNYTQYSREFEFNLEEPDELTAQVLSITNNICFTPSLGVITIEIKGGTLPYIVNGDFFNTSPIYFTEKATGTYNISVNDSNNCKPTLLTAVVKGPTSALSISNKVAVNNVCNSSNDDPNNASLSFDLSGGSPFLGSNSKEYYKVAIAGKKTGVIVLDEDKFYIEPGATKTTVVLRGLKDDDYTVTIVQKDPNVVDQNKGCEIEFEYKLSKSIYFLDQVVEDVKCTNEANPSGKFEMKGIYGGKPFIDSNNKKYYNYKILNANGSQLGTDQKVFQGGDLGLADSSVPTIVISNLPQGKYSIQFIDDGSGCDVSNKVPFEIFIPKPHTIQLTAQTKSCNEDPNGTATVKISGGVAPYQVSIVDAGNTNIIKSTSLWFGVVGDEKQGVSEIINGLSLGAYKIKLEDSNQCTSTSTDSFTIDEFDAFTHTNIITPESCFGSKDGKIVYTINGGSQPLVVELSNQNESYLIKQFRSDDGNGGIKPLVFENLSSGTYTLTIKDQNNQCIDEFTETVILPGPSEVVISSFDADIKYTSCYDKTDGSITIDVTGGGYPVNSDPNYDYLWKKDGLPYINYTNPKELKDLGAGVYTVRVTPRFGNITKTECAVERTFSIKKHPQLYLIEEKNQHLDVYCNGAATGFYKLYFTGGIAPYSVISNGAKIQEDISDNYFTKDQLFANTYEIDIEDANGCKFSEALNSNGEAYGTIPIIIDQPDQKITFKEIVTPVSCNQNTTANDGTIQLLITGGIEPYNVVWEGPNGFKEIERSINNSNGETKFKITGPAGNYKYTIFDSGQNCVSPSGNPEIKAPEELIINEESISNATEYGKLDGKYTFSLAGNVDDATFTNYETITKWFKIVNNEEEELAQYAIGTLEVDDLGVGNYRIKTTAKHKTIVTTTTYGATTIIDTAPSNFIECTTFMDFEITEPKLLKVTENIASHVNVKCYGSNTGAFTLNITGGTAPYKVLINNEPQDVIGNLIPIDQLTAGVYSIEVIDAKGYRFSQTKNPLNNNEPYGLIAIEITQPNQDRELKIDRNNVTLTNTSCGLNNGKIVLNANATVIDGPDADKVLSYFWTGPEGWTSNTRSPENLAPGDYNLTIVDKNSCSITTDPFQIKPSLEVKFDAPDYVILNRKTSNDPAKIEITNIKGTEVNGLKSQKIEWFKVTDSGAEVPIINTSFTTSTLFVTSTGRYRVRVTTVTPCSYARDIEVIEKGFKLIDNGGLAIGSGLLKGEKPQCYNGTGAFIFKIEEVQPKPATTFAFYLDGKLITLESDFLIKYGEESPERKGYKLINVPIGVHVLKLVDEFGSESVVNFEIENRSEIRLKSSVLEEYIVQKIKCLDEFGTNNLNKAVIDITNSIIGGIGAYKFRWTGPSNFSSPNARIEVAKPGTYDLVILDENNCESKKYSFTISAPDAIVITEVYHKNLSCRDANGSLEVNITGGVAPFTIEWINEDDKVIGTLFELSNLPLGEVRALVTDSNGCSSGKQVFEIIDERLIIPENPKQDDEVCIGKPGYIEAIITKNNTSTLKFYYNNVEVSALKDTAELYRIIIDNPVMGAELKIINSFGCSLSYTYQFGIAEPKLEILNAEGKILDLKDRIAENEEVVFKNKSVGTYIKEVLVFGDGTPPIEISRSDSSLTKRKHTYVASGVYTSTMEIINELGCSVTIKRPVFVGKAYQLKFPTSFSPNLRSDGVPEGDKFNDNFRPIFNGFKSGKMIIYDVAGVKLYEESFSNPEFKDTIELTSWIGWNGQNASLNNRNYFCVFEGVTFENLVINETANFYLFK
jgi:hypothetical protein